MVFLDVEDLALSLAPILNHKAHERDARGSHIFAGEKLDLRWKLDARKRLVGKGVLQSCFARLLWQGSGVNLSEQAFDVMVKLGILLPVPQRHQLGAPHEPHEGWKNRYGKCGNDFLVLMRLPLVASSEITARFDAMARLHEEWGLVAKWRFDRGSIPFGLVERLIASCHEVGDVIVDTCWRNGACFEAQAESKAAGGGTFALTIEFVKNGLDNEPNAGTLAVRAFGHREGRAVWGVLRFVISSTWRLFREFPGLGWEAWVESPERDGEELYYLAGVNDTAVGALLMSNIQCGCGASHLFLVSLVCLSSRHHLVLPQAMPEICKHWFIDTVCMGD